MNQASPIPHSRPWIIDTDRQAVQEVLKTNYIAQGQLSNQFESAVANYTGSQYAIAQSSGTAALILALRTLQVGAGDSVLLPTYVCRNVLEAILSVGARPKLCDVNDECVIDPTSIEANIDSTSKAIIAVHIFGHPAAIMQLKKYKLFIIEDACQSFGLKIGDQYAGTIGDVGIFSFHATKCLTTGEGGMLVTNHSDYASTALRLSQGTEVPCGRCVAPLSDLQASLGLAQLKRYKEFEIRRHNIQKLFANVAQQEGLEIVTPRDANIPFRFTVRVKAPFDNVRDSCERLGVTVRKGVDQLLHRYVGLNDIHFPNSVSLFNSLLSVPFYPSLDNAELLRILDAFNIIAKCQ